MTTQSKKEESAKLPRGIALLRDPSLNKGTAFTSAERDALGLRGLLPPRIFNQQERVDHVLRCLRRKPNDLERYMYLSGLQDRNERLFFRTGVLGEVGFAEPRLLDQLRGGQLSFLEFVDDLQTFGI